MNCRHYLCGSHFSVQTDRQSLMHSTKSFQESNNGSVVRGLRRFMQCGFTVNYIKAITNVVHDASDGRPLSSPTCAATTLVRDDSRFLSSVRPYLRGTHAPGIWAKLNAGEHVKRYSLEDDLLWFYTKRVLRQLYVPASLPGDVLRKVQDNALAGHGVVNKTVGKVCRYIWWR